MTPRRYCRCERDLPYSSGPAWEVWTIDPDRAWCQRCQLDVAPADVRRTYAQACVALDHVETKWPELTEADHWVRRRGARRGSSAPRTTSPQTQLPGVGEIAM
jgi:hypothetical protein